MNLKKILFIVLFFLFLAFAIQHQKPINYDPHYNLDPEYVLNAAGFDKEEYVEGLKEELKEIDNWWGKGDTYLMLTRLENKSEYYEMACFCYEKSFVKGYEEKALLYETLGSLNCSGRGEEYLVMAKKEWLREGVEWRVLFLEEVLEKRGVNEKVEVVFDTEKIEPKLSEEMFFGEEEIVLGATTIRVGKEDKVLTQVDRVYRDWLGRQMGQSPFRGELLVTMSERLTYSEEELRSDMGWHEGGRMKNLVDSLGVKVRVGVGTIIVKNEEGKWYAPDEKGVFSFEVPFDKVSYPQHRFLSEDVVLIMDTHGVNMLVEQTLRREVDVVLSDCDHEDKTKAAVYLSERGVSVLCFPDRFLYYALGHGAKLLGSPVWRYDDVNGEVVFGDRPVVLKRDQKIVVTNADVGKVYAIWYYTTPWLYFSKLNESFSLDLIEVGVDDFGQLEKVFSKARELDATIVATRVFSLEDYLEAKKWLEEDEEHKVMLFHSTMYPHAVLLMQEFSEQVTFNDPNPVVG